MGGSLRGPAIPDAGAIHAAKKKRELARQRVKVKDEREEDFISLVQVSISKDELGFGRGVDVAMVVSRFIFLRNNKLVLKILFLAVLY